MKFLFTKTFIYVYLSLVVALYLYSLWDRVPDVDDAWIGEYTWFQAQDGHAKSELMRGITHQEDYLVVHHKLLTLNGAMFIKIFGFSIYTLKSVSLAYFIIFICLFYYYTVKYRRLLDFREFLFALILLFSFPWAFKFSFIFRPEIMLMTLGFAGFIFLERTVLIRGKSYLHAFLAGLFMGLGLVTHLNGIAFAGAGLIFLLLTKRFREAPLFILGTMLTASIYFYDFNQGHGFAFWYYQFMESPSLDGLPQGSVVLKPFLNLANEHQRFFHNPMIMAFSVFVILCFVAGYKYIIRVEKNLLIYTILVIVILGCFSIHKDRVYILLYLPYLILLVILSLKFVFELELEGRRLFNRIGVKPAQVILFIFLSYYLLSGLYFNFLVASDKANPGYNAELTRQYVKGDPSEFNIIAPMTFIFNEIEKYNKIQGELCYTELQKSDSTIYGAGFLQKASEFDIDYIFLTPYFSRSLGVSGFPEGMTIDGYSVLANDPEIMVLERQQRR
jgi:hypothetical protein